MSDGANLGTFLSFASPEGIAFDGTNLWISTPGTNSVVEFSASTGAEIAAFQAGSLPQGVAFDGANIWVTNVNSSTVSKL
ncbi:MAG TPA: hypothetical protein VKZ53_28360 [Candidatus Angelobacter sp.]|nr:hypothetical protein [Candidatus Angelobacter sp.]